MKLSEDIRPISYIKSHSAEVLNQINNTRRPMYVTQNGEARAIIVDPVSYQNTQDSLKLMKLLSQGEIDVLNGRSSKQADFFSKMDKKLGLK